MDRWILGKDEYQKKIPKKYFILEWSEEDSPHAYWHDTCIEKYDFKTKIQWKIGIKYEINIVGKFKKCENINWLKEPNQKIKNIAFLKSHLQKNIRRSNIVKSINTAYSMIKYSYKDFIRRLPIIVIEDTILIKEYTILIWLMSSSKDYNIIYDYQLKWLLNIVKKLAECKYKDKNGKSEFSFKEHLSCINTNMDEQKRDILYSLELRKAYGGMKSDQKMLSHFLELWYNRFSENNDYYINILFDKSEKDSNINYKYLEEEEIEDVGIDFHCYPPMLDKLNHNYPTFHLTDIKKTIWYLESAYTNKVYLNHNQKKIKEKYYKIYNIIKFNLKIIREYYIKTILNN